MMRYILTRVSQALPTPLLASVGIFVLLVLVPSDAAVAQAAMDVAVLVGGVVGILAAADRGRWPDVVLGGATAMLIGVPFYLGMLAIILFRPRAGLGAAW